MRSYSSGASRLARLASAIALAAIGSAALAQAPVQGLYLDQNLQAAYNPLGAQLGTKFFYRAPLNLGEGVLWEPTRIDVGIKNSLSPAFDMVGLYVDILPIAVFDLALSVQAIGFFDAFGFGFRELSGYGAEFGEEALEAIPDGNALGLMIQASPTFQIAFGPFAFMDTLNVNYFAVDDGEGYFHDVVGGAVLKKKDIELYNDAYAMYTFEFGLLVGLNDSILYVPGSGYTTHCLQAVGVYTRDLSEKLSLYAAITAGAWLEDKYFKGMPRVAGQVGITARL